MVYEVGKGTGFPLPQQLVFNFVRFRIRKSVMPLVRLPRYVAVSIGARLSVHEIVLVRPVGYSRSGLRTEGPVIHHEINGIITRPYIWIPVREVTGFHTRAENRLFEEGNSALGLQDGVP